ncbi:MAG: hypothetical protein RR162_00180 [Oscillospiraceae bacterium]
MNNFYGGLFDTKEEAEKYKKEHDYHSMVVEYLDCFKKWAIIFDLKVVD